MPMSEIECAKCGKIVTMPDTQILCSECFQTLTKQWIIIYLDTDCNGDDLLDGAGNPIPAGWYRYSWPITGAEPSEPDGPFETEIAAADGVAL